MTLLLDADFLVYRVCYTKDKDFIQILETLDWYISDIIRSTEADDYKIFLTGSTNFRKEVATIQEYKGNRKKEKPKFYYEVRDYMVNNWGAEISENCEADDLVGIHQTEDTIIGGEDKDLLTIPGWHYRIKKKWSENCKIYVSEEEACYNFHKQLILGDRSDHIPKIPGIGEVRVKKLLDGKTNEERKEIINELYKTHFGEAWFATLDEVARLVFIQRRNAKEYYECY
jgi:hypothetical protein